MADSPTFSRGDLVRHASRPEWGTGVVDQATAVTHQGRPAQQLVVRFEHHGRITLNSAVAPLLSGPSKEAPTVMSTLKTSPLHDSKPGSSGQSPVTFGHDRGWLGALGGQRVLPSQELARLPDPMTDPFSTPLKRLSATLESFRFSGARDPKNARLLLEWAQVQSGLKDPLSKYTRHEIEEAFPRFVRDRDNHLAQLVKQFKHAGRFDQIEQAVQAAQGVDKAVAREAVMKFLR